MIKNKYNLISLLCLVFFCIPRAIDAQSVDTKIVSLSFEGRVIDSNNKPIEGAQVSVQEQDGLAITDNEGSFSLSLKNRDVLIIEKDGYKTVNEVFSAKELTKTFVMQKYLLYEGDIQNTSYGTESKRYSVSSIASIDEKTIEKNSVAHIQESMQGTLAGLFTMTTSGDKLGKSNLALYIRGKGTKGGSVSPLILIDDVEGDYNSIDYNEVESVTVLKDAVSLAMYGMRGANGVILIKTKRGSSEKSSISLDIRSGIQQAVHISDRLNAYQYTSMYNEALTNDGEAPMYDPSIYKDKYNAYDYPNENFKDDYLKSTSSYQNYTLSARGGNNIAQYYVSGSYLKQDGLFKNTNANNRYERYNFRSNVDVNLRKGLTLGLRAFASIDENRAPYTGQTSMAATDNIFNQIITTPANAYPIFNPDGSLGGTSQYQNNIYGMLNRRGQRTESTNIMNATVTAKQDLSMILPGLSVDAYFGIQNFNIQQRSEYKSFAVYQMNPDSTYRAFGKDDAKTTRSNGSLGGFFHYSTFGAAFNYAQTFGKHQVSSKLLVSGSDQTVTGDSPDIVYQGVALRASDVYDGKYIAELTAAYQGSNNFMKGHRYGLFPAVGLGWIISQEKFLKGNSIINFAKLRTTYGINGNDQTGGGRFPYRQTWTVGGGYNFASFGEGTREGALGDPNQEWEKSYKFDLGVDLKLFNDFQLTADYFSEVRKGILVNSSNLVPNVIGIGVPKYNGGQVNNHGLDMSLMYTKQLGTLGLFVQGNLLWAKNEIIDMKETPYQYDYQYQKGHSVDTRFGYQVSGIYTTQAQLANASVSQFGTPQLGDLIYVNQNPQDDKIINSLDQVAIGNTFPELTYGLTLGANYHGFDFATTLRGLGNYDVYFQPSQFTPYVYENRWTATSPDQVTPYPRLSIGSTYNNQVSDFWQENGRSLSISSLEFGYTFPKSLVSKMKLNTLRIYINGNNLYTFSNIKDDRNPQAINAGYSESPLLRTWSLGLSVKL